MKIKLDEAKKRIIIVLSWISLAAVAIAYIVFHLVRGFAPALETEHVVLANESFYKTFDAYVMRNETVLTSDALGFCDYRVDSGAYSKTEAELARVYEVSDPALESRVEQIDSEIALLKECARRLNTVGIRETRDAINASYRELSQSAAEQNIDSLKGTLNGLRELMYLLEHNTGRETEAVIQSSLERITALEAERTQICASLGAYTSVMSSGVGNFFHGTDGYEEIYSSANIDSKTLADFYEMFEASPDIQDKSSREIGTYMTDFVWYIAVPTDMNTAVRFTEYRSYSVRFSYSSGHTLKMTLEKIVRDGSDSRAVMLFSCGNMPEGFDRSRVQKIEILTDTYSGYRIPSSAIFESNGQSGVWILTEGKVSFRGVQVLHDNGLYSIVEPQLPLPEDHDYTMIDLNDTIIMSGKGLYEGKLID